MDEEMTKEQAWLEMNYPKHVKLSVVYGSINKKIEVDSNEFEPGRFETILFPRIFKDGQWTDDLEHPLRHMGSREAENKVEALVIHQAIVDYLTYGDTKQPELKRYY